MLSLKPRKDDIVEIIKIEDIKSLKPEDNIVIPNEIKERIGDIKEVTYPKQGHCSLVMIISADNGKFALKIAKGKYRGDELYREYCLAKNLIRTTVPVIETVLFLQKENEYYYLSKFCEGITLSNLFFNTKSKNVRYDIIKKMAEELRKIHNIKIDNFPYKKVSENQLYFAKSHFKNNTIDIYDFVIDGVKLNPKEELEWLKRNKFKDGRVTLIHGDYRPKNMIWENNRIKAILDWAFCDIGDPYYDIAMVYDYFNEEEKHVFNKSYGISKIDIKRIEYQAKMIPFLNI